MATRRSSRVKQQLPAPLLDLTDDETKLAPGEDDAFESAEPVEEDLELLSEVEDDEDYEDKPRPRKKAKVKKEDKDKGALEVFASMPADILAEICSHLMPLDLLHLARINHSFRSFLHSPNAVALWSNARREVGLPELKVPFKTEEQYASLMWEKWCMTCDREEGRWTPTVDYVLRKRCCGSCTRIHFLMVSSLQVPASLSAALIAKAVTSSSAGEPYANCFKKDALAVVEHLKELSKDRFAAMLTGKKGEGAIESFVKQKQEFQALLEEDGVKLRKWAKDLVTAEELKADALKEVKCRQRRAQIEEKLQADGWDPIDFQNNAFALDEEVFHPKKLTKKGWESVQDHVVGLLTGIRDARLEREARGRQRARRNQLKDYHQRYQAAQTTETKKFVFPSHLHFIALRSVRPLWEEDVELDDARFAAATPAIDFAIQCLRVKIITKLFNSTYSARVTARYHLGHNSPIIDDISAISTTYLDPPDPKNKEHVLRLVSSIIYCKGCSSSGFYPEFVSHACPRDVKQWGAEVEAPLVVDGTWVAMVWSILAAIGKKEAEVQGVDELEQVGKRFVCGSCLADQVDGDQIHAYGWKLMIEHAAGMHGRPSEVKLLGVGESFLTTKKGARVRVRV